MRSLQQSTESHSEAYPCGKCVGYTHAIPITEAGRAGRIQVALGQPNTWACLHDDEQEVAGPSRVAVGYSGARLKHVHRTEKETLSGWQLLHQGRKHNKKTVSNQRLVWNLWYRLCYPGYRLLDANIIRFNRNSDTTHQTLLRLCVRFIGAVSHSVTFIVQSVFVLDPHGARKREKTKDNT